MPVNITNLKGDDLWAALTSGQKVEVDKPKRKHKAKTNGGASAKPRPSLKEIRRNRWLEPDTTELKTGPWEAVEIVMFVSDFTCRACNHHDLQPAYPFGANVMLKMRHTTNQTLTRYVPAYSFGPDTSRLPSRRIIQKRLGGVCPHCFNASEEDHHEPAD